MKQKPKPKQKTKIQIFELGVYMSVISNKTRIIAKNIHVLYAPLYTLVFFIINNFSCYKIEINNRFFIRLYKQNNTIIIIEWMHKLYQ